MTNDVCFLIACVRLRPFQFWGASNLIFGCVRKRLFKQRLMPCMGG